MMMPVVFAGHGSPLHALANNPYTQMLSRLGNRLLRPKAILAISAHWMTSGTKITADAHPKTIHDFYGFPDALFKVQYPAPGSKDLVMKVQSLIPETELNSEWGYDHGTWAVLRHMYPKADIPVAQLSFDPRQSCAHHFRLGQRLAPLREEGILILGSGNIVHNLRAIKWQENAPPDAQAVTFDHWVKERLKNRDFEALQSEIRSKPEGAWSVPTWDHYHPLMYVLGAVHASDELTFEFDEIQNASIAMRTLTFGTKSAL